MAYSCMASSSLIILAMTILPKRPYSEALGIRLWHMKFDGMQSTHHSNITPTVAVELNGPTPGTVPSMAVAIQSLSSVWLFSTPWTEACHASLSSISQSLLKFMSIESMMPSKHLTLGHPLLRLCSIFSSTRVLSGESAFCIWWPKFWSFSFSISLSYE